MMHESGAEAVAYALFERVCYAERKDIGIFGTGSDGWERPSRSWIFSTYGECLKAARATAADAGLADLEARPTYTGARRVPRAAIMASDPV